MARGHQAIESQRKNAEKQAKIKKSEGKSGPSTQAVVVCGFCKASQQQLGKDINVAAKKLAEHVASHSGKTMADCFPDYTPEGIARQQSATVAANSAKPEFKADKENPDKKKQSHKRH